MNEHWQREQDPPPTVKDKLIRLLVNVSGVVLTLFLILVALAVVRNAVHGVSVLG